MTLLEKVQELQSIKPPLNETELRTRLDAWKLTNLEVEEFDSNVDSGIKQDPNVQIIKPSFDIDPNVEVEEVEGNSEVVAEKGAAVITDPLLDAPIIEPTIFNNKRKKPLPFDILEDLKNKDFNSGIIPRETIKDTFSKFKIPSVQYDKNLQLAEQKRKSKKIATVLAFPFFFFLGVHKFYLGQIGQGIVYLLFCFLVIPSIIALFEFISYLSMSIDKFDSKFNPQYSYYKQFKITN